jgi:chromosome segregation ATPase
MGQPGTETLSEDDRMSGLELASYAPSAPQSQTSGTKAQARAQELAALDMANFGTPDPGFVGAIKYWLRVRRRLKDLTAQYDQAMSASESATNEKQTLLAELGRKGHAVGIKDKQVVSLISRATIEEGELRGAERRLSELDTEYKTALKPLEAKLKDAEAEAEPIKQQEKEALGVQEKLFNDRNRIEAKLKRAQIEIRNLDELVAKRQGVYANPETSEEERAKLFQEMNEFENKRPPMEESVRLCQEDLAVLAKPIAEAEMELGKIRGVLSEKLNKINSLNAEIKDLSASYKEKTNQQARKTKAQSEKVELAWTAAGEAIITQQCDLPEHRDFKKQVVAAMDGDMVSKTKVAILSTAMESYDHNVVSRAKVYSIVGLVGIVAIIVLLLIFL